ncbi:hypothetical protein ACFVIM_33580 [Streptomyces sp. NPDC057638]|uniref:hypothetical protein n=1 Tax=Streptomyces sp. NPDC057638 TaxID=3346190 RepID=UPI0036C587B4
MLDTTELTETLTRFADRVRAAPQSRLERGVAAEALGLARELALRAQRVENPDRAPMTMPDAGMFALADQLMVAGNDLVEAWRVAPPRRSGDVDDAVELVRAAAERAFG